MRVGHPISIGTRRKIGAANAVALKKRWQDPEYRARMAEAHRRRWQDPVYAERMRAAHRGKPGPWKGKARPDIAALWAKRHDEWASAMSAGRTLRPTKPEQTFLRISDAHGLGFRYVGDGQFRIGGLNPDFVREATRQVVEVLGRYWHRKSDPRRTTRPAVRLAIFRKMGWRAYFLWEDELKDERVVLDRVRGVTKCEWG